MFRTEYEANEKVAGTDLTPDQMALLDKLLNDSCLDLEPVETSQR